MIKVGDKLKCKHNFDCYIKYSTFGYHYTLNKNSYYEISKIKDNCIYFHPYDKNSFSSIDDIYHYFYTHEELHRMNFNNKMNNILND